MFQQCLVDYFKRGKRFSLVGACEGAIAGLVGITPAAGFVSVWAAALIGFLTAVVCSLLENVNDWLRVDDGLEVFKLHGIGGMVGSFLTGIFAQEAGMFRFYYLLCALIIDHNASFNA